MINNLHYENESIEIVQETQTKQVQNKALNRI